MSLQNPSGTPFALAGDLVTVTYRYNAPGTFERMFVATRAYRVHKIWVTVDVIGSDGGGVTAVVQKNADTKPFNDASIKLLHSGSINLKGTADTLQKLTLSTTPADLSLAAGDTIMLVKTDWLDVVPGTGERFVPVAQAHIEKIWKLPLVLAQAAPRLDQQRAVRR